MNELVVTSSPVDCTFSYARGALDRAFQIKVIKISDALKERSIRCLTVLEYQTGDLHKIMMRCIELAECVVVFINKAYEDRISGDHVDDDCLLEFHHAYNQKTVRGLIPVVLEADMRDQKQWTGFLQIALGRSPFLDMSGDLADEEYFNSKIERLLNIVLDVVMVPSSTGFLPSTGLPPRPAASPWTFITKGIRRLSTSTSKSSYGSYPIEREVGVPWGKRLHSRSFVRSPVSSTRSSIGMVTQFDGGKYKGEMFNNQFHGYGRYEHKSGNVYEGEFADGKKHGKAVYTFKDGHVYEGEYRENKRCGYGVMRYANGSVYEGEWMDNLQHGHGKLTYADGDVYEGEYKQGQYSGKGVYRYADGSVYQGDFTEDVRDGFGMLTATDGSVYEGEWREDKFDGIGMVRYANGCTYRGGWRGGLRNGRGLMRWASGDEFEGGFANDKQEGVGVYRYASGGGFEGEYSEGKILVKSAT